MILWSFHYELARAQEEDFNEWYNKIHLPDVIDTPGYIAATRYKINEFKKGRGSYLAVYEVETDDIEETIKVRFEKLKKEIAARRGSDLPINVWPFVFFRRIIRRVSADYEQHSDKSKWIVTVETNSIPGKEEAYNAWYDHHLDEVLESPGYIAASRYVIKEPLEGRGKYLAIYEIVADDVIETIRKRRERKAEEVRQGKDPGLYDLVWDMILYKQIFRYPTE
jgi:antibiotic biosynthesis monooxygenase (ABM) superfamily enzyme